jgi:hypothetical protein
MRRSSQTNAIDLKTGKIKSVSDKCNVADRRGESWYLICGQPVSNGNRSIIATLKPDGSLKELVPPAHGPPEEGQALFDGKWVNASLSPDGSTILAQWSSECEVDEVFMAPVSGGKPIALDKVLRAEGHIVEAFAIGWTKDGRAIVAVPGGFGCSDILKGPGIYLIDKYRHPTFVYGLPTLAKVAMWKPLD